MTLKDEASAQAYVQSSPEYDAAARDRIEFFLKALADENKRQNLVADASLGSVWQRHVADSAQLTRFVPRGTFPWLDLGTGAGFPGLVIAILRPQDRVILIESRPRRAAWLERMISELGLVRASVEGVSLERVEPFVAPVISARAFAPLPLLVRQARRFSTSSTVWLLPKGRSAAQELREAKIGRHMFHVEQSLTNAASGIIVGTLPELRNLP